ncbi:hypothetical protein GP486_001608 [Trichoglossum hirsutum]|uniref:Cell division cycle protein 123 n=1 Tax=Trichoglossum hirsutum TaxID=265104 RepID=A0A9P8RSY1_9PEZI|nr:hypothetical protein GP486_001608 [Trichoglossum hirsutum]
MASVLTSQRPVVLEYISSCNYETKMSFDQDPFRHYSLANSHNHHSLHPWGPDVKVNTPEFDSLYACENSKYMYHLWYSDKLAPYMSTEVITVHNFSIETLKCFSSVLQETLANGIDSALKSSDGQSLLENIQTLLDEAGLQPDDQIFIRLGTTSAKDSFAVDLPTTKPSPLKPDAEVVLRRILTSRRCVCRLLALTDGIWHEDPGEALIVQRWSPDIELRREFRVFVYKGRITAISQDIWWKKLGWRKNYSDGFVNAISDLWDNVKDLVPFDSCTMDVLVSYDEDEIRGWKARLIEFNGFGAHLNTGSDLFHWVNDADILQGKRAEITVRFVDDWEASGDAVTTEKGNSTDVGEQKPDWLALEEKIRASFDSTRLKKYEGKLPLRGRWSSSY